MFPRLVIFYDKTTETLALSNKLNISAGTTFWKSKVPFFLQDPDRKKQISNV